VHILVTAGPTREYLDPVRYISNASSGKMGLAVARAAIGRGHRVTLVTGPVQRKPVATVTLIQVMTTAEMARACLDAFDRADAVIMTASVCDYRPARLARYKLKKSSNALTITLVPTVDILARLGRRKRPNQVLIGFALEDRAGRSNAMKKLKSKKLDAIVLNSPASIAAETADFIILHADGESEQLPACSKRRLATRLVKLAEELKARR